MNSNTFELIGRVNFIEIKYTESGTAYTRVGLSKKGKEDKYEKFPIVLFGEKAEAASEAIKKGDSAYFTGRIGENTYKDKETGKEIEKHEFIAFDFKKVEYDTDKKQYVEVTPVAAKSDTPW